MTRSAFAHFLPDLDRADAVARRSDGTVVDPCFNPHVGVGQDRAGQSLPREGREPSPELLELAFERGRGAGRQEAVTEWELTLAVASARADDALAQSRQEWTIAESERLASAIHDGIQEFEARLHGTIMGLFKADVMRALELTTVSELAAQIVAVARASLLSAIEITGRQDLVTMLIVKLAAAGFSATGTMTQEYGLSVRVNDSLLKTNLEQVMATLFDNR
jgi:hypothetical protein